MSHPWTFCALWTSGNGVLQNLGWRIIMRRYVVYTRPRRLLGECPQASLRQTSLRRFEGVDTRRISSLPLDRASNEATAAQEGPSLLRRVWYLILCLPIRIAHPVDPRVILWKNSVGLCWDLDGIILLSTRGALLGYPQPKFHFLKLMPVISAWVSLAFHLFSNKWNSFQDN